jgi:hypothetical protein
LRTQLRLHQARNAGRGIPPPQFSAAAHLAQERCRVLYSENALDRVLDEIRFGDAKQLGLLRQLGFNHRVKADRDGHGSSFCIVVLQQYHRDRMPVNSIRWPPGSVMARCAEPGVLNAG